VKEIVRIADSKGRVVLPGFANATLIVEKVDETEYRIRKAKVIPEATSQSYEEELALELSGRDAAAFLRALDEPPEPNAAARKAAREFVKVYGRLGNRKTKRGT
jgi:hypothetical protein